MECESRMLEVAKDDVELLRKLVSDELARRLAAIEDSILSVLGNYSAKWTEDSRAAVKVAVLELVRSPLADLERKLGAEPVEVAGPAVKVAV